MKKINEYDCWLQSWGTQDIPATLAETLSTVRTEEQGDILARGVAEFRRGIHRCFGFSVGVSSKENVSSKEAVFSKEKNSSKETVIGTIAHLNASLGLSLPIQNPEGFVIQVTDSKAVIAGQDQRGALYGVYRFLALLRLGKIKIGTLLAESPASSHRIINHWDNLDGTVERGYAGNSLFYRNDRIDFDPQRIEDYARLLASVGINRISINNANVRRAAKGLITEQYLPDVAKLADIFRPFGIQILLSINFASPYLLGNLPTADPLDPAVAEWWKKQSDVIYRYIPDLAGFVVKADSEFEPGPFQYGRTHADGANMLANALKPHKGEVIWRCFVYNCTQDWRDHSLDRARAAYDHFMPLDGSFADNVLLQIKFGPYDFQVREPVSPLFGALSKTRHIMELQITQEYTGQQIDVCYLPWVWEDIMNFDTACGDASRIRELLDRRLTRPKTGITGLAGVGNTGLDQNWTGHTLAQANLYGYGRLAWNPGLSADSIADEWCSLTFGDSATAETVKTILMKSYRIYEKYNAPFGVCFMVNPAVHYGPSPEGYEFSKWGTYHRADSNAVGIDRTPAGTGYTEQYQPQNAALFRNPATCPEKYLLFFHRLRYDYPMKNGETLLQNIYNTHFEGYEETAEMLMEWEKLKDAVDETVYAGVLSRMERQARNAREWRDVINTYFYRKTGIPDAQGRKIYE